MQHETSLHFQNDMRQALGVATNLIGRISRKRCDGFRIQRV
jgi:hypothetical protein